MAKAVNSLRSPIQFLPTYPTFLAGRVPTPPNAIQDAQKAILRETPSGSSSCQNPSGLQCIVLDLDETCLHSMIDEIPPTEWSFVFKRKESDELRRRAYSITLPGERNGKDITIQGLFRPYLFEFLQFVRARYPILAVWSAGTTDYVNALAPLMTERAGVSPADIVFSRPQCVMKEGTGYHVRKPLVNLLTTYNRQRDAKMQLSLCNVIAIDDKEKTFETNADNGIQISSFSPDVKMSTLERMDDYSLLLLACWMSLPDVAQAEDIKEKVVRIDKVKNPRQVFGREHDQVSLSEYCEMLGFKDLIAEAQIPTTKLARKMFQRLTRKD